MSDADFDAIQKLQRERNEAAAAKKKGSRALDSTNQRSDTKASLTESFDTQLYDRDGPDKYAGYLTSIPAGDGEDEEMEDADSSRRLVGQYTATRAQIDEFAQGNGVEEDDPFAGRGENSTRIIDRMSDYQKRQFDRALSPSRADAFKGDRPDGASGEGDTYREVMERRELEREEERVRQAIKAKREGKDTDGDHEATLKDGDRDKTPEAEPADAAAAGRKRKKRWDVSSTAAEEQTPQPEAKTKRSRWDQAPALPGPPGADAGKKRSRWDQAPSATPVGTSGLATPMHTSQLGTNGAPSFGTDVPAPPGILSDEELDTLLPGPDQGYKILEPPEGYSAGQGPIHRASATPLPANYSGFMLQDPDSARVGASQMPKEIPGVGDLQFFKPEDMAYFGKLTDGSDENSLSVDDMKERKIMRLLLKVKNGTPPMRKTALRQLTDNARQFGAGPLFNQILPLLMEKTLEDQERHLLVKVIDRVLYKLDDMVRPYVHKILVVIEPLLIDQDYYARVEGREIISNLSKAAGLATMISTMRPDIDHSDEYVRNTTARAFAVVASAL